MNLSELKKKATKYLMPNYGPRTDISFVRGKGIYLFDSKGRKYLDFLSGLSVNSLGHCPSGPVKSLKRQAKRLWHTSNLYHIEPQVQLAEKIIKLTFPGKVFFCNSGAEANESAFKLARLYGKTKKVPATEILYLKNSFHGRTLAALTATGQNKYKKGFEPLPSGFRQVLPNNIADLKKKAGPKTCAIIFECLQAEGGLNILDKNFVKAIMTLAKKYKFLTIVDEVQTGFGRTGSAFSYEHFGIKPDMITLAKALGNGFPIGALVASSKIADTLTVGTHASTFGGNFLSSSVGLAVLNEMENKKLFSHVKKTGKYLHSALKDLKKKFPNIISEIRGQGFLVGLRMKKISPVRIISACRDLNLIIGSAGADVVRLSLPLITTQAQINQGLQIISKVLDEIDCQ